MPEQFNHYKQFCYNALAVLLCVFILTAVNTNLFNEQPNLALFGMLGLILVFLNRSLIKAWSDKLPLQILDTVLIVATLVVFGYVFVQSEKLFESFWIDGTMLGDRAGNEKPLDFVIAGIGIVLVLEATRRAIGWTLPILCLIFIAYAIFGQSMPDWLFPHRGASWQQIAQKTFLQSGGVFGIALRVMFMYVFLFVLFGTMLEQTGATGYVIRFARRLFKNSAGGPAKVAVVSSGLMGSLSGSAVANTATTGTFTIPLMKSSGFDAESAAGVEAAASSGGALMPPIMGAGAYMMLEMVEPAVTYVDIIKAAFIPAILYYTALLLTVHFHSQRIGAEAEQVVEADDDEPMSAYQGFVFLRIVRDSHRHVGFRIYAVSRRQCQSRRHSDSQRVQQVHSTRSQEDLRRTCGSCQKWNGADCGCVLCWHHPWHRRFDGTRSRDARQDPGVRERECVAGDVAVDGLNNCPWNGLTVRGLLPVDGHPSSARFFKRSTRRRWLLTCLSFTSGMMSMVTPPVALAAYAAAAIAKADVMRSAFAAFRFALVGFALPFAFVLKPQLLMLTPENTPASPLMIAAVVAVTLVAICGLAASIAGYAFKPLGAGMRLILLALSLTVFLTRWQGAQLVAQLVAAGVIVVLLVVHSKGSGNLT